jgi:hypothetical protein
MQRFLTLLLVVITSLSFADVPHTFQAGDPIDADKFNENFRALDKRIDDLVATRAPNSVGAGRKLELITTTVNFDGGARPKTITPVFTNSRGLQNVTLKAVLNPVCHNARSGGTSGSETDHTGRIAGKMIIDDTHTVFVAAGVETNIPVENKIIESLENCFSSSTFSTTSTILIEYDE